MSADTQQLAIDQLEAGDLFDVPSMMPPLFDGEAVSFKVVKTSKHGVHASCHWFGVYVGLFEINTRGEARKL